MIICTKCGAQNEDADTFCGSCAGFLEWSGERVVEEVPEPEPEPEPEPDTEHAGLIERVKDRIGIGDTKEDAAAPAVASEPAPADSGPAAGPAAPPAVPAAAMGSTPAAGPVAPPAAPVAAVTATPAPSPAPAGGATPAPSWAAPPAAPSSPRPTPAPAVPTAAKAAATSTTSTTSATSAVAPAAAATAPVQPAAVKPAAVKARPVHRAKAAPSRVINPGDLVCGQCGEGNDANRKFCRRCGASLQEAAVFNLPWYRRVWRSLTTRKPKAAGERPHARRRMVGGSGPGWLTTGVKWLIVGVVAIVIILAFVGPWKNSIRHHSSRYYHDALNDVHPTYTPIHPPLSLASASSSAPGHPAQNAIDEATNTCWQTGRSGDGVGQSLTIRLAAVTDIDKIGFINGDQDSDPTSYLSEPRPELVHITFEGPPVAGPGPRHPYVYVTNITLKDVQSFQTFTVSAKKVNALTISIDSVYPSGQGNHAAIAEVELFRKS